MGIDGIILVCPINFSVHLPCPGGFDTFSELQCRGYYRIFFFFLLDYFVPEYFLDLGMNN